MCACVHVCVFVSERQERINAGVLKLVIVSGYVFGHLDTNIQASMKELFLLLWECGFSAAG